MEHGIEVAIKAHFNGEFRDFTVPASSLSIVQFQSRLEDLWGRSTVSQCRIRYQQANKAMYITNDEALRSILRSERMLELVLEPFNIKGINVSAAPFVPGTSSSGEWSGNVQQKSNQWEPNAAAPPERLKAGRSAARFVEDVTVPENTEVLPGTRLTKIWKIRNAGMLPWPDGSSLIQIGGDEMGGAPTVQSSVLPGREGHISVDLVAPSLPGQYLSYWRMAEPTGRKFGQRIWCGFRVVEASDIAPAPGITAQPASNQKSVTLDDLLQQHECLVRAIVVAAANTSDSDCRAQQEACEVMSSHIESVRTEMCEGAAVDLEQLMADKNVDDMERWLQLSGAL